MSDPRTCVCVELFVVDKLITFFKEFVNFYSGLLKKSYMFTIEKKLSNYSFRFDAVYILIEFNDNHSAELMFIFPQNGVIILYSSIYRILMMECIEFY